jgi:hypothetical protein
VNTSGFCVLNYTATICGDHDFVGVYINAAQPEQDFLDWEWCTNVSDFPYVTSIAAQVSYVAIYWSYDYRYSTYVAVCITPTLPSTAPGHHRQRLVYLIQRSSRSRARARRRRACAAVARPKFSSQLDASDRSDEDFDLCYCLHCIAKGQPSGADRSRPVPD